MKTKHLLMILIGSILLIFSGCSNGSDGAKTSGLLPSIGSGSTQKGGSGIELTFAEGQPGNEYNKGQPFNFGFIIKNYQNHDISDMKIKISGVEWGYINGLNPEYSVDAITKATTQTGPGIFSGLYIQGITVDKFSTKYNFNPKFNYCYTAKTIYREQVCIPSKTTNSCNIKVESGIYQNGPMNVKINSLTNYDANTVIVNLQITNSGNGKVTNECFKTEDYANEYKLNFVTLGTVTGDCSKTQSNKIVGNTAVITCTFPRGSDDAAYPSQLVVDFDYKYEQSTQKNILIKDYTATTN